MPRMRIPFFSIVAVMAALTVGNIIQAQNTASGVEIRMHNGRPTVFIDGKPDALPGYNPWYVGQFFEKYTPSLFPHRFSVYHLDIPGYDVVWDGDQNTKNPVFESSGATISLENQVETILKGDPGARFFIRMSAGPSEAWSKLHPQEFFINEQGKTIPTPSLASDVFWEATSRGCAAMVQFVEARPWADRVIGYGNFHVTEGVHVPVAYGWMYDHNPLMTQRLREFLRKKYATVQDLWNAYGDSTLTFDTAEVPKDRLLGSVEDVSGLLYWQNARDNQGLRDYLELQRDLFHRRFRQLGAAMEGSCARKVFFLHDALKQPMMGWNLFGFFAIGQERNTSWNFAYPELMAGSGSMDAAGLFGNTPGFDGLVTPHDYQARGIGGVYEPEGMADSAILRGAYFMSEMDTRYSEVNHPDGSKGLGSARNVKEWAAITWRNFASSITRGYNSYWHHAWTVSDWFYSPAIHEVMQRQVEVIRDSVNWPHETVPGIAMILDDSAALETNGSGNYYNEAIMWEYKMGIARCGVPFRIYLFEDLELDNFPKHRVYYFPNLFRVDDKRLELLKKKVFRNGNIVVWGPGSGISDGKVIGAESASSLTGFAFTMMPVNAQRRILISNFEHPVTRNLPEDMVIGGPLPYGPVLMPADGTELGLAWAKGGNNHIGLAIKEFGRGAAGNPSGIAGRGEGDYAAIFTTAVPLPADLWRNIAGYAGAHIYTKSNDVFLADTSVVALHSLKSGKKSISLPGKYRVTDLVSGKRYSNGTSTIVFDFEAPETRVFLLE